MKTTPPPGPRPRRCSRHRRLTGCIVPASVVGEASPGHPDHPAVADFLHHLRLEGREETGRTSALVLRRLAAWLHGKGIDAAHATSVDLNEYRDFLATDYRSPGGQPLARSTLACHCAVIRGWYHWLVVRGVLVADPSRDLAVQFSRSRVVVRSPLTLQEVTALIQTQAGIVSRQTPGTRAHALAIRTHAAICIGVATGRRVGGMCTLRVADLDLVAREIRIEKEKGHAGRVVPIAAWAVTVIAHYLHEARPRLTDGGAPWLFVDQLGQGPIAKQTLLRDLHALLAQTLRENPDLVDLPAKRITWHSLRVSFATLLFSNGCDIRSVNELMLHRCLSTTALYTPIPVEDLRRVFLTAHPRA